MNPQTQVIIVDRIVNIYRHSLHYIDVDGFKML